MMIIMNFSMCLHLEMSINVVWAPSKLGCYELMDCKKKSVPGFQ